ncbi:GDP-mannose-dependent alpha-(1-6)-phosphatidylinositol monomannoside mannosyltransferase [Caloramator mitchellensis]|uniref:GDP-mannose-dependent alpha-(1-6)-phosphatidylinositol monomannoside mannosyltransferase n=1 Tax=Caloramator mitchellensis TaxID=908809 RepID=A0A0R3JXM7_CALMK|nr:glycosyltransferase [Caloramator mitchellensis]KRQ85860.1 GDP-mannose-dependent alpha-(1-6)-phosphatidylinositol monomannoside mannosyltransferase [Caloramator mitchellensis]
MKVLQINSVCGVGSTGRIATDIHQILKEQGHESYIAYGRGEAKNCDNAIRIGNDLDIYKHVALTRIFDKHGFSSKKATIDFIKKVEKINPDVIHLHNIHGYYINIEVLFNYLKTCNKRIIWTLHDCWAFTGHCAYFDYVGCDKWKKQCDNCPQKNKYPQSIFIDNSYLNYKRKKELFTGIKNMTIVTPSNWLANLVKESFLNEYEVKVIHNGIDLNVFKPVDGSNFRKKYNIQDKFIILGVANVWDERKGLKYFIELSKMIDENFKIVIVGLNEKQLKSLPKNIIGIKRTNSIDELVEIYSASDVFVNPTLEEVLGLVNLEALVCGTPVITFNTGGSVECIENNSEFIVEKVNIDDLIAKILKYKDKKDEEKDIIKKESIIRVKDFFDKDKKFYDYIKLYNNSCIV